MFEATKLHEENLNKNKRKHTLRIGNKVPDGAVNLAYYFNKRASADENVLIAEAPKNTIDHITVSAYLEKKGEKKIDDSIFPLTLPYNDNNGYSGRMKRKWIKWNTNEHIDKKDKIYTPAPTIVTKQEVDQTIPYQEGEYKGTLHLQHVDYEPYGKRTDYETSTDTIIAKRKMVVDNLPSPYYNFPELYSENGSTTVNQDGYKGQLHKVPGAVSYWKVGEATGGVPLTRTKTADYGSQLPESFTEMVDGQQVTFRRVKLEDKSYEKKMFGKGRWLGNYANWSDANGIYGDAVSPDGYTMNSDYSVTGPGYATENIRLMTDMGYYIYGRGHWSQPYPRMFTDIYKADGDYEHNLSQLPMPYGSHTYGTFDGEEWVLDTEESAKYGSPNGHVWADKYYAALGSPSDLSKAWPPPGYTSADAVGGRMCNSTNVRRGNVDRVNFGNPIEASNKDRDAYKTSYALYDRENPGDKNYWFRDVIIFYKVKKKGAKATYIGYKDDGSKDSWSGEQEYQGPLTKSITVPIEVITSWKATTTYAGAISKIWYDYDGLAYYEGIATKRTAIGNINPEGYSELLMYPDDSGILHDEFGYKEIESELFHITNMFKDGVPLYYMYKLKNPIYDNQGPDEYGMYRGNAIKLVNSNLKPLNKNKYKYQIKLKPYKPGDPHYENLYDVYIFTSFLTTSSNIVKCIYNAYNYRSGFLFNIQPGLVENIYVQPFYEVNRDYKVISTDARLRRSYIQLVNNLVIPDSRNKLRFLYVIKTTDGTYTSQPISAEAINKNYALSVEKDAFIGRNYIVSPLKNGRYLTAHDIIVDHCNIEDSEDIEALKKKTFVAELLLSDQVTTNNRYKLNLHTNPDGSGVVSVETTEDTGFFNEASGKHDKMIALPGKYIVKNSKIYPAYMVKCRDVRSIKTLQPRDTDLLPNWYARVQFGHFNQVLEQHGVMTRITYALPEFDEQDYSPIYGRPYVDITDEQVEILNEHNVKTKLFPLYVEVDDNFYPLNLKLYRVAGDGSRKQLNILSWSFTEGFIEVDELISENDRILADYTYEEQSYVYRGFYDETGQFIDIEFNPNQYHTYLDNTKATPERREVYNLFNAIVYFFLKPSVKQPLDETGKPIPGQEVVNTKTLYHKINDPEPDAEDHLMIGSVYCRHNTSLKATQIIDTRTRGGGLIEEMLEPIRRELEPESDYYWDIGYWDGEPYTENAVVVIRLDRRILKQHGGRFTPQDVEAAVHKWIAAGVIPIIEYVQTFANSELPQATLVVNSDYQNKIEYTPFAFISTENIV